MLSHQRITRIAGVPSPLLGAAVTCLSAAVGWYLAYSGDTAAERALRSFTFRSADL